MNPWELLGVILGWSAVIVAVILIAALLLIVVGVVVGLAKGNRSHVIMSSRNLKRKRNE